MTTAPSHADITSQIAVLHDANEKAHTRLDKRLDKVDILMHGKNGASGGFVRDMAVIKSTLRAGLWLAATLGSLTLAALVAIFFKVAAALGNVP